MSGHVVVHSEVSHTSQTYDDIKHQLSPRLRALHEELIARLEARAESWRQAPTRADWDELLAELRGKMDPDPR